MITFEFQMPCEYRFTLSHKKWLKAVIRGEKKEPGDLFYVFCTDSRLLEYNRKYLGHDTLTDIITFDETEGGPVSGSILVSLERVGENAAERSEDFAEELLRVVVHGVLHLCGYKDKTPLEEAEMRRKENAALKLFHEMNPI